MKVILFTFLFSAILISQNLFSQVGDISTDRPDQSESPYLMDKGYFLLLNLEKSNYIKIKPMRDSA